MAPVVSSHTRVLVLGSFPGVASLASQQYYAHPRNQFWPVLAALWPQHPQPGSDDYEGRCQWLLARGLGLWDVYAACERSGSLDSAIRHGQINDFAALAARCPQVLGLVHNGAESARHAPAVLAAWPPSAAGVALTVHRVPSTSPAHAAMGLDAKCEVWRAALAVHGLV